MILLYNIIFKFKIFIYLIIIPSYVIFNNSYVIFNNNLINSDLVLLSKIFTYS